MEELEKYKKVNQAKNAKELKEAILFCGDIQGRISNFSRSTSQINDFVDHVVEGILKPHFLPTNFGIRQQALYLAYRIRVKRLKNSHL